MKKMLFVLFWCVSTYAFTQPMGKVEVVADPRLEKMEQIFIKNNKREPYNDGFRIQVYQSTERAEVFQWQSDLKKNFPDLKFYIEFHQPYFRLRVGNFRNRFEGLGLLSIIKESFPHAYMVADHVDLLLDPEKVDELRNPDNEDDD